MIRQMIDCQLIESTNDRIFYFIERHSISHMSFKFRQTCLKPFRLIKAM